MRRGLLAAVVLLASVGGAVADDKILVLRAEGRADKQVRAKVEAAVLELAKSTGGSTTPGDVTFGDAATMVGCSPDEDACKVEVLGMLAVDEIVTIATARKPGGIEVTVRRIGSGGATRTATALVAPDRADRLDAIAPLFGGRAAGPPSPLPPPVTPAVTTAPAPAPGEPTPSPAPPPAPPITSEPAPTAPAPTTVADAAMLPPPADEPRNDRPRGNRRLAMFGMAGGGVMLVVGIVFWASAKNIESEIADAPTRTREQLEHVQDLEAEGDAYATTGNVLAVGGLILGGVSTYYFLKSGKRSSRTASVAPILGHGTGIAITWGGSL